MNRLTSGTASLFALLLVGGCHGDPTESLRGGVARLEAAPSTMDVTLGRPKTTQVTAVDDQGNPLTFAYELKSVGSGISVRRDSSFFPVYLNDTLLSVPPEAVTFQYIVTGTDLVSTNFVVSAGGKDVTIPVLVGPDPANVPVSTVTSTGPNASDPTVITAPAGYIFASDAAVAFDAGPAIVLGVSADGTTITILPPPGATSKGVVTGLIVPHLPQSPVSDSTDVALTINATVPSQPGTDSPSTAPDVSAFTAFYDGAAFTGSAGITGDAGALGAQYYKFTPAADADVTFSANWSNTADVDLIVCSDATCSTGDAAAGAGVTTAQPEEVTVSLTAGTTYYIAVVLFEGTNPDWVSVSIAQ